MAKNKNDKPELLMRAIKAVHGVFVDEEAVTPEALEKQRTAQERFSTFITPSNKITTETFYIDGMEAEWVKPEFAHDTRRVILYSHGGGFTCGGINYARILAGKLAIATGFEVLSYAYRLAPEHPFPAQIDDAQKVWDYLMLLGFGADHVYLAGDSAGGNLSLELCLRLKQMNRMLPRAMVLMSPWTDMTLSGKSYEKNKLKDPTITMGYVRAVRSAYTPKKETPRPPEDIKNDDKKSDFYRSPEYSPLYADLSGMPSALIQAGSFEVLRSDSESLLKQYRKHGSFAKIEIYRRGWHVFQLLPTPIAAEAMEHIGQFIQEHK